MGGGNAQKSAISRERNAAKAKALAGGKSQKDDNDKAMSIQCAICKQAFMCTQNEQDLMNHITSKHAGKTFDDCFAGLVRYVAVPSLGKVFKGRGLALTALGSDAKKGYPKDCGAVEFSSKEDAVEHVIKEVSYINDADGVAYEDWRPWDLPGDAYIVYAFPELPSGHFDKVKYELVPRPWPTG